MGPRDPLSFLLHAQPPGASMLDSHLGLWGKRAGWENCGLEQAGGAGVVRVFFETKGSSG